MPTAPSVVIIGGPNGAGKSTIAPQILRGTMHVSEFVNADVIARGLSLFHAEDVAMQAGRSMLVRLKELAKLKRSFAFETTLASRSFAPWVNQLRAGGYRFQLVYIWLPSWKLSVHRVRLRITAGGHSVPADVIERRYVRGLMNFVDLYRPLADHWRCYDGSSARPALIAHGGKESGEVIYEKTVWTKILAPYRAFKTSRSEH